MDMPLPDMSPPELTRDDLDRRLLAALEPGLPLVVRPYLALARRLGVAEQLVIHRIADLQAAGTISRFGVVVRHHELGYLANAMVVWDVADEAVEAAAGKLTALPFVTLCYRRPRRPPSWPYNLFCMIHGRCRQEVVSQAEAASQHAGLAGRPRDLLFSRRRFKQRGARYGAAPVSDKEAAA